MYYLQSSLSEVSKIEQELAIDHMMSEVGLSSYPDANALMSLKSKAVSPNIKSICSQFNELLETIVKGQEISKANFFGLQITNDFSPHFWPKGLKCQMGKKNNQDPLSH